MAEDLQRQKATSYKAGRLAFANTDSLGAVYGAAKGTETKSGWSISKCRFKDNASLVAHNKKPLHRSPAVRCKCFAMLPHVSQIRCSGIGSPCEAHKKALNNWQYEPKAIFREDMEFDSEFGLDELIWTIQKKPKKSKVASTTQTKTKKRSFPNVKNVVGSTPQQDA